MNTEAKISQAVFALEVYSPKKKDFNHLLSAIKALWPEPDDYDAGFTTADQYMNFIKSLGIPANDPDFQNWIQSHRQNLGDLLDAANKLIDKFDSPYAAALQKIFLDVTDLQGATHETDLTRASLDLKYLDYDKGFTTADEYAMFLKEAAAQFPSPDDPNLQDWLKENGMLILALSDAATKMVALHSPYETYVSRFLMGNLSALFSPNATGSDVSKVFQDLQSFDFDKGFTTDQQYIDYLKNLSSSFPADSNTYKDWVAKHQGLLNTILLATERLQKDNAPGAWSSIHEDVETLKAGNGQASTLGWLGSMLGVIGFRDFQKVDDWGGALDYLMNLHYSMESAIESIVFWGDREEHKDDVIQWLNNDKNRQMILKIQVAAEYAISQKNLKPELVAVLKDLLGYVKVIESDPKKIDLIAPYLLADRLRDVQPFIFDPYIYRS